MEDNVNVNQECNPVSMVTLENNASSSFTSEQFKTCVERSDMKNKSSFPDYQCNTSSLHINAGLIKKVRTY